MSDLPQILLNNRMDELEQSRKLADLFRHAVDEHHATYDPWYSGDAEAAHKAEDELLWSYVEERANQGDDAAKELLRIAEHEDRERWYA